jgi:hypothetical protein
MVIGKLPVGPVAVPLIVPVAAVKVSPLGRVPVSVKVGAGVPVAVTVNVPGVPIIKAEPELFGLVIAGAGLGGALFVVQPATKRIAIRRAAPSTRADTPMLVNREARIIAAVLCGLNCFREKEEMNLKPGRQIQEMVDPNGRLQFTRSLNRNK